MNINWKVRAKNPQFWLQLAATVIGAMLMYAGTTAEAITTWPALIDVFKGTFSNPYSLVMIAIAGYNAVIDPTTSGIGDSAQALTYTEPKTKEVNENGETE